MLPAHEYGHVGAGKLHGKTMIYIHSIKRYYREFTQLLKSIWKQRNGEEKEILYINYWRKKNYQRKWFYDFLTHRKLPVPGKRSQLVLISIKGRRWMTELPFGRPKVFFTAENTTGQHINYDDYLEDTDEPSYTTKKLFDAFKTGAIPLYWGSGGHPQMDVLTGNGIVFFDPDQPRICVSLIKKTISDVTFRQEFLSKPKTHPDVKQVISGKLDQLEHLLKIMLTKTDLSAYRQIQ